MLRTGELARIQSTVEAWLPSVAAITRPDGGQTDDGYPDATPTSVASGVACRVEPASARGGQERLAGAGVTSNAPWNIVFGHDVAAIKPQDVIVVTSVGTFEVVSSTSGRGVQADVVANCVKRDA
jgi:hypothetical protein